jgi:hypothetical protein
LKFLNYFNYRNKLYSAGEQTRTQDVVMFVTCVPLFVLLIVRMGCYRAFPLAAWEWLFLSTYLLTGLAYAVFFTRIRFRLPFDCLLICLVAHFVGMALAGRNGAKSASEIETRNGT